MNNQFSDNKKPSTNGRCRMIRFLMYYFGFLFGLKALGLFEDENQNETESEDEE